MIRLLPPEAILLTSGVDHGNWTHDRLLGLVIGKRYALVCKLLPAQRVHRILEVGFGSGIFMPELASRCDEVFGIDVHQRVELVREVLRTRNIDAQLAREDAASTHFPDETFDIIVAVSALEFIEDIAAAAHEAARILVPRGRMVAVMPADSRILDFLLRMITGQDPKKDYGDRRKRVLPAILQYFAIERKLTFGPFYTAYEFKRTA